MDGWMDGQTDGRTVGHHHLQELIYSFSGEKKNIEFYFRMKHRTRKYSSVS